MHPEILRIYEVTLPNYAIASAIAVIAGIVLALARAGRFGFTLETVVDITIIVIVTAALGSRLWYVLTHLDYFISNWLRIFSLAGLSQLGGIILAIAASKLYALRKNLNFLILGDAIAPSFLLGAGILRLGGCYTMGCCFGRPTETFLGITFPPNSIASSYFSETALWPTQLFASALGFLGVLVVLRLERRHRFPGFTLSLVFVYYALDRFVVDQFRYYPPSQTIASVGPFTVNNNHLVLMPLLLFFLWVFFRGISQLRLQEMRLE